MTGLTRKMGVGILCDTLIDKALTPLKLIKGDNMEPEEKHALARKVLDVIDSFSSDIGNLVKFTLPLPEPRGYSKSDCDLAVSRCMNTSRVDVKRYKFDGRSSGISPIVEKYRALRVFYDRRTDVAVLNDLSRWDFKNKYEEHDVTGIRFAKDCIAINYSDGSVSRFEPQEDGKLKVYFYISNYSDGGDYSISGKLITEFTLDKKPKK